MKHLISVLTLALAGCATPAPHTPRVNEAALSEATLAHMNCLSQYGPQIDDGRSDASTIASALARSCPTTMQQIMRVMGADMTENQRYYLGMKRSQMELDLAQQVVLKMRVARQK